MPKLLKDNTQISNRRSIFSPLKTYIHKEHDFIEVTEWTNSEGYDITISERPVISLHYTEFELIKKLIKKLDK